MKWNHNKKEEPKVKIVPELYAQVNTCCECEIYIYIQQTYDYKYKIYSTTRKICDIHREAAITKFGDSVRSKLI